MSSQVTITQLPVAGAITGTESVPIVQNGVTVQTTTGAIAASPAQTQTFLTVNQEPTLANSRRLGATNGLTLTDGGAQSVLNVTTTGALSSLVNSGTGLQVKTNSVTLTGRAISSGSAGLSVSNGDGISGNPTVALTGQVLNLANASVNGLVTLTTGGVISSAQVLGTSNQINVTNGDGLSGSPTVAIAPNPTLPGTAGVALPSGTTAQRASASNGTLRYNSDTALLEAYLNGVWTSLAAGTGVTSVATGTGLTGGPITSAGTISIANTAVTAGSYTSANITVNAQGQITAASNGSAPTLSALTIGTGLTGTSYNGSSAVTIGIDSTVATLTGTQTLTNKTISGSSNTLTDIANGSLTNSSVTVGSTSVSLGGTASALAGLSSVAVTADPTTALQLTTKQYVDGLVSTGLTYHQPVQAATTASLASTTGGTVTYNNGTAGVGATITLSVALTVLDGYTLVNTNRILIKNEVNQAYNGIYTWATGGTVLTRATDADTYGSGTGQLSLNDYFFTQNGTVNKGIAYVLSSPTGTITFGTSNIVFSEFSTSQVYTGSSPISISGTVISLTQVPATLGGTGTSTVAVGDLLYGSATNTWSKLALGAAYKSLTVNSAGTQVAWNAVALDQTAAISGTLGIANGGTNSTATPTSGGAGYGTGTAHAYTAAGTAGQVLLSNGSSAPTWSGVSGGTF
jgi:hypothetical protein